MSVKGGEISKPHRVKKLLNGVLASLKQKADDIDIDELKEKGAAVASRITQKVEDYDVKRNLDSVLDSTKKQTDKIQIDEVKAKIVDTASNVEADLTSRIESFRRTVREKKERFFAAVKLKLLKIWRITKWILIIILAGSVVGMFLPQGNPVAKTSCYARGIAYYTAIGSFPTLSTGEDALRKIEGNCARSGGIAFGSDD